MYQFCKTFIQTRLVMSKSEDASKANPKPKVKLFNNQIKWKNYFGPPIPPNLIVIIIFCVFLKLNEKHFAICECVNGRHFTLEHIERFVTCFYDYLLVLKNVYN